MTIRTKYSAMEKQLIEILTRLVDLKDYKDKYGKDKHYLQEQPVLWEKARTLLKACEGKADQTSEKDLRVCEVIASAWISVEKQLPNHRQKVLFCTRTDVHKALYMEKMSNEHGDFNKVFLSNDGGHYELEMQIITHWMPLPEPPN